MTADEANKILGAARWYLSSNEPIPLAWAIENGDRLQEAWTLCSEFSTLVRVAAESMSRQALVLALAQMAREFVAEPWWQGASEARVITAVEQWARGEMSIERLLARKTELNLISRVFVRLASGWKESWANQPDIGKLTMETVAAIARMPGVPRTHSRDLAKLTELVRSYFPPVTLEGLVALQGERSRGS
jgi:hypothetical protein